MSNVISQTISIIKNWWLFLLNGILLIAIALWVFFTPEKGYESLAWVFTIIVLISGISNISFSITNRNQLEGWGWYLGAGIYEFILGIVLIFYPDLSVRMLPLFVGFWLLFRGGQIIGISLDLRKYGELDWALLMFFGIGLTVMASFMILDPLFGMFNVVYLTSIGLILFGVANIMFSLKLKNIKEQTVDKVRDFKKNAINDLLNLKEEVINKIKDSSSEIKEEVDTAFKEYKSKLD